MHVHKENRKRRGAERERDKERERERESEWRKRQTLPNTTKYEWKKYVLIGSLNVKEAKKQRSKVQLQPTHYHSSNYSNLSMTKTRNWTSCS